MSKTIAQLKTENGAPVDNTPAVDEKPKDTVKRLLTDNAGLIRQALPRHINGERLLRISQTAILSNPKLLDCYVPTLIGGVIQCAQMGLEPNTVLGHAYLVPFRNTEKRRLEAQVIPGYKGYIDLARRSKQIVSIAAHVVCEKDEFSFRYGLNEQLDHVPFMGADDERGPITHFYAVARFVGIGHAFEVMSKTQVDGIRARAKTDKVWSKHYEEMGRKTAIRRLAKYLPLSVEMAQATTLDAYAADGKGQPLEEVLDGDYVLTGMNDDEPESEAGNEQALEGEVPEDK